MKASTKDQLTTLGAVILLFMGIVFLIVVFSQSIESNRPYPNKVCTLNHEHTILCEDY